MTKKLSSKLLSVILTIAICASAVFGCLITANAEDSACYSWSSASVSKDLTKATVNLTIDSTNILNGGIYNALFDVESECFVLENVVISGGERADGETFAADDYGLSFEKGGKAVDISANEIADNFAKITLEITLKFTKTVNTAGPFPVTLKKLQLTNGNDNEGDVFIYTAADIVCDITAKCEHVVAVKGSPINVDTVNGYSVYADSYCTICEEELGYQLVPSTESLNGLTITWSAEGAYDDELIDEEDGEQLGTSASPIIINSVEELYYIATQAGIDATKDKYFKLADGIDNVVLQSEKAASAVMNCDDANEVKAYFVENGGFKWDVNKPTTNDPSATFGCASDFAFAGNFDGNGATFYGLYDEVLQGSTDAAGLFPYVHVVDDALNATLQDTSKAISASTKTVTISNVNIKNSYLTGTYGMGFIVGKSISKTGVYYDWNMNVKKCSIVNNYMYSSSAAGTDVRNNGLIAGPFDSYMKRSGVWAGRAGANIENCLVYGNVFASNQNYPYGATIAGIAHRAATIKNSIILGATPYLHNGTGENDISNGFSANRSTRSLYSNIYTDAPLTMKWQTKVEKVDGVNTATAWTTINYGVDGSSPAVMFSITGESVLGYNAVTNCPNLAWDSVWSYGADGEYPFLGGGATASSTIYWDGTSVAPANAEGADGSKENPIIIHTAEELNYICNAGGTLGNKSGTFNGKWYKMADGIKNIILQPENIVDAEYLMGLTSAEDVKTYLTGLSGVKDWVTLTQEWYFNGNFNGNGVKIYGLYTTGKTNAGLFSCVDPYFADEGNAVYKDVKIGSWDSANQVEKLSSTTTTRYDTNLDNPIEIGGFSLNNSYIYSARRVGAIVAMTGSPIYGLKYTGVINIEDCALINSYVESAYKGNITEHGLFVGTVSGDLFNLNNCLVYGNTGINYTSASAEVPLTLGGQFGDLWKATTGMAPLTYKKSGSTETTTSSTYFINGWAFDKTNEANPSNRNKVTNSIILGVVPYGDKTNISGWTNFTAERFSNVYTDAETVDVYINGSIKTTYAANQIAKINPSDAIGTGAKTAMPNLKWGSEWFANINDYPSLAAIDKPSVSTTSNGKMELLGSNMTYNEDGTLDFNFHFTPSAGYTPVLYVGKADKSGVTEFITLTEPTASSASAKLGADAMMFTIPNLAARDVNTIWVPTLVATNGSVTEWGMSQQISLGEYANAILSGDVTYASEEIKAKYELADKKVAASLLNYADAATTALGTKNDVPTQKNKVVYYGGGAGVAPTLLDPSKPNSESNPFIIDTAEKLLYIVKEGVATTKEYYKVPDNISAFVLQTKTRVDDAGGFDELKNLDAEGTMAWFDDPNKTVTYKTDGGWSTQKFNLGGNSKGVTWQNWNRSSNNDKPFQGNFDGNGVTIYGMVHTGAGSLFGYTYKAEIKNINVRSSYVIGYGGAIISESSPSAKYDTNKDCINKFSNISVESCCVVSTRQSGSTSGFTASSTVYASSAVMLGSMALGGYQQILKVDNCVVNDVISYNMGFDRTDDVTNPTGLTLGDTYYYNDNGWKANGNTLSAIAAYGNNADSMITDSIFIGAAPYSSAKHNFQNGGAKSSSYINVYTDAPSKQVQFANSKYDYADNQIKTINPADLKGAKAISTCALDFDTEWLIGADCPTPLQAEYTPTNKKTIYWDGNRTAPTEGEGTKENPIIINTAAELAYVAYQGLDYTTNGEANGYTPKYFEIADNIGKIVLQDESHASEILSRGNVTEVKDYFTKTTGLLQWTDKAFQGWASGFFGGHFDGNGVEIYGMYCNAESKYAALFPNVDGNATISNVTVKNAYLSVNNASGGWRAAAIAANTPSASYGDKTTSDLVVIENCGVANSYIAAKTTSANEGAILFANPSGVALYVNNCYTYGNESYSSVNSASTQTNYLIGQASNDATYESMSDYGKSRVLSDRINGGYVINMIMNSVLIDANPIPGTGVAWRRGQPDAFINTYTTVDTPETWWSGSATIEYIELHDELSHNILKGDNAASIVAKLNAANDDTVWYVGGSSDYPSLKPASSIPAWLQGEYDAFTLGAFNNYSQGKIADENGGEIRLKSSSLNLGANPYISFVFSIKGDYLTNRNKINFTFKTVNGEYTVTAPAYSSEKLSGKWINSVGNATHTYQFTEMPVSAFMDEVQVWASYDGSDAVLLGTVSAEGIATSFMNANKKAQCNYYANAAEAAKAVCFYAAMVNQRITL